MDPTQTPWRTSGLRHPEEPSAGAAGNGGGEVHGRRAPRVLGGAYAEELRRSCVVIEEEMELVALGTHGDAGGNLG